jgi:hypothetical protein
MMLSDVVALYQQDRDLEAMLLLRSVLAPDAALAVRETAKRLAAVLAESGHFLALPVDAPVRHMGLIADPAPRLH